MKLQTDLKEKKFCVLGFPSNDFGKQEPGTADEIRKFCAEKYNVNFPLFEKLVTKEGKEQSPIYANLQKQSKKLPKWNFSKYLIAKDGTFVKFYDSKVNPHDEGLRNDIEAALNR